MNPSVDEVWADKDFQGLPPAEKQKVLRELDPDFKNLPEQEQLKVVGGEVSAPSTQPETPEQPGVFQQALNRLAKPVVNATTAPLEAYQKFGEYQDKVLKPVTAAFEATGVPAPLARIAEFGRKMGTDPLTYIGSGTGAKAATAAVEAGVEKAAPTMLKVLADVPEEATNVLLKTKDLFKKATGSEAAIDGAVKNVQDALKGTLKREGNELGKVEEQLGIAKTAQEKIFEMVQGRDTGGYVSKLGQMKPEELLGEYVGLKATNKSLAPTERLSQLVELKRALNDRINTFGEIGSTTQGLLKTAAKDIDRLVKETPGGDAIRSVQAKYARARTMYNSLQNLLKDEGQAQQILENVFKSSSPKYKTIRNGLAELEKMSGRPVLTELFQQFAAKSLNKAVGRSGRATLGGGIALSGLGTLPFHPLAGATQMAVGGAMMASQSPRILAGAVQALPKAAGAVGGMMGAAGGATAGQANTKVDINKIRQYLLNSARRPGAH